jgi:hypothetical protein
MLQLLVQGKPITVFTVRVNLAYTFNETNCWNTISKSEANTTQAALPPLLPARQTDTLDATPASPLVSTPEQPSPRGGVGDVGASHNTFWDWLPAPITHFETDSQLSGDLPDGRAIVALANQRGAPMPIGLGWASGRLLNR